MSTPLLTTVSQNLDAFALTLDADRKQKALTYAKAGIVDYWILDVNTQQVYVLRQPNVEGYQQETILNADATLSLVAFPDIKIPLNQLFPEN